MGKNQQHALINRLAVLLMYLLKWQFQPARRSRSWELTIIEQRQEVIDRLEDNPSLKQNMEAKLAKAYNKAVIKAERETGIRYTDFPAICPYNLGQVLDDNFCSISKNTWKLCERLAFFVFRASKEINLAIFSANLGLLE
jgi:Domain of unknown function DUF29